MEGRPDRVRMQGAEPDEFEAFCRRYGVSDVVLLCIGRAFDAQSGYVDWGVADGVQPLGVLLALIERGFDPEERRHQPRSLPCTLVAELNVERDQIEEWRTSYLSKLERGSEKVALVPSRELGLVMSAARRLSDNLSHGESVAARHVLGALLEYFENFADREEPGLEETTIDIRKLRSALQKHLEFFQAAEPAASWNAELKSILAKRGTFAIGGELHTSREAGNNERCLNVDDYADALAELFSRADDGEFCFAVYGHWGRGKTFLMRCTKEALAKLRAGYLVIDFKAWKYPTAPEVWVHLYETFANEAFERPWWLSVPNAIRTSIAHRGTGALLRAYALFAIGLVPFFSRLEFAGNVLNAIFLVFGVTGLIWLWTVVHGIQKTATRLTRQYITPTRHNEKLGLQATIGCDLRALLIGLIPKASFGMAPILTYWAITFVALLGTWLRLTELGSSGVLKSALGPNVVNWSWWGATAFDALLLFAAIIVLNWIQGGGSRPKRVLLVVDDLDRCKPEHLLSVMESIKLLIEDQEISSRVQVAMLVEEEILKHAIYDKYKLLTDQKNADVLKTTYTADRLMRENCEKLFTASLRLPQLSKNDLRNVISSFAGRGRFVQKYRETVLDYLGVLKNRSNDKPSTEVPSGRTERTYITKMGPHAVEYEVEGPRKTIFRPATPQEIRDQQRRLDEFSDRARPVISKVEDALKEVDALLPIAAPIRAKDRDTLLTASKQVLEDIEADAVLAVLADDSIMLRDSLGPRSIRAFLFRYQFARLLLAKLGMHWDPITLARELAEQVLTDNSGRADKIPLPVSAEEADDEKLRRIIQQVC
jgi:hypothetical protein